MIKDITLGQYFPGKSPIHAMDARMKIVLTMVFIIGLFLVQNLWGYLIIIAFLAAVIALSKVPPVLFIKGVKPLLFIILFTAVLNLFYGTGEPLWQWGFLRITANGIRNAVMMALRIILLIAGTSVLTYTTSPIMLTDAIEQLLGPLKRFKLPVHELAMMMTIALRFIPTLIEETDKIMNAQKARGADFESGKLMERIRALIPILVPLFVSAFRRADELAIAMECRCYHGGEGRTRMKQMHMLRRDVIAAAVVLACLGGVIALNILF